MQNAVPSHEVIMQYIKRNGEDFRCETSAHPIEALRNRKEDNTTFSKIKLSAREIVLFFMKNL